MDIKKPDSPIMTTSKHAGPRQTGQSHNQSSQQALPADLNTNSGQTLKIGQHLELIVLKITSSTALLDVVGTSMQVHTNDKALLQLGQKIKAQISQTQPIIQLKVLSTSLTETDKPQALINEALRRTLPKQQSIKELINNIQLLTKMNIVSNSPLQKIKNSFVQSSPPSQAFSEAQVLPQILKRSGLFTENLLASIIKNPAHPPSFPNNDLKISLLRLATQLRALQTPNTVNKSNQDAAIETNAKIMNTYSPALVQQNQKKVGTTTKQPGQHSNSDIPKTHIQQVPQEQLIEKLINLAEGSIAKLQTQQLQQQQLTEAQKPAWTFELPIRNESSLDSVTIYINKDDSNKNTPYLSPWSLVIKLSIEDLGEIQANVSLRGNKISVVFWLDNTPTTKLFEKYLQLLEAKLNKAGLDPDQLKCHCDKPPSIKTPLPTPTLNEEI